MTATLEKKTVIENQNKCWPLTNYQITFTAHTCMCISLISTYLTILSILFFLLFFLFNYKLYNLPLTKNLTVYHHLCLTKLQSPLTSIETRMNILLILLYYVEDAKSQELKCELQMTLT